MLNLVFDLKTGFEDCYLTIKDYKWDLALTVENPVIAVINGVATEEETKAILETTSLEREEDLYERFKDNTEELMDFLEYSGELEMLYESSVLEISKKFFSGLLGGIPLKNIVPIFEPYNIRLEFIPEKVSEYHYLNGLSPKEVFEELNISRQQLYYYVKTGQIKKVYSNENPKKYKYDRTDVIVVKRKLIDKN